MSSMRIREIFKSFNNLNVLIIGDAMIDAYFEGRVERISPEAPVPIVAVDKKDNRLGGAANVALNIKALGANPILCSVVGNDENADIFNRLLMEQGLVTEGVIKSESRVTTVKTRIIGNKHQLMRVDSETDRTLGLGDEKKLLEKIVYFLDERKIDVIIFEDYDKGVITADVIQNVVAQANQRNIPTTVDPKKRNFLHYKGVTLFKPNLKELREGLEIEVNQTHLGQIQEATSKLHELLGVKNTFVTLSEHGVYIKSNEEEYYTPAHLRNISDVSGAGDTVISVASLCIALGESLRVVADLSNLAGGLVCEKVGVVPIDKSQLMEEAISLMIAE